MNELKPRDRFTRAIRREKVDRVPTLYRFKKESKEKVARIFGIQGTGTGMKHDPSLEIRLGNDAIMYQIGVNAEFSHHPIAVGETWYSDFKVGYGKSGLEGMNEEQHKAFVAMSEAATPLGRLANPDEIAAAALFLASDESSYVNGSELYADGGSAQI